MKTLLLAATAAAALALTAAPAAAMPSCTGTTQTVTSGQSVAWGASNASTEIHGP